MAVMTEFLTCHRNPSRCVYVALSTQLSQIVERNTKAIESLFKIVIFCGKQGLALRSHRDDKVNWQCSESANEGNFLQLVRFRAETDQVLVDYLQHAPKNAL